MSLEFSYSNWWLLLGALLSIGISYWLYYRTKSELNGRVKFFLAALRALGLFTLLLLLLNPLIKQETITKQKPIIAFGIDNSASILQNKDSLQLKKNIEQNISLLKNQLADQFDLKTFLFDGVTSVGDQPLFKAKQSNPSSFLETIENNYSNQNIAATLLLTDGIVNEGEWPEGIAEKIKGNIYAIALGDTTPIKDASIDRVYTNTIAYLGNTFPVEINIKANALRQQNTKVKIQLSGTTVAEQAITYSTARFSSLVKFNLPAKTVGLQSYRVILEPVNGEQNLANNVYNFTIEVLDAKEKIVLLANGPHPDVAAIKQSVENNENYTLDYFNAETFTGQLEGYSLVILHQLNAKQLSRYTQSNTAIWYIGHSPNLVIGDLKLPASAKQTEIDAKYNKGFGLFSINEKTNSVLQNAPPVFGPIGDYNLSSNFQSLFYQKIGIVETEQPLLAFSNSNGKKIGVFLGDGLWKWRLHDFRINQNFDAFNEIISKSIQYLSTKEDKSFFKVNTRKNIKENEALIFDAEVYDNTYTLTTEAEVTLALKNDQNKIYNYTFSKNTNNFNVSAGTFPAGNYKYEATVKYKGQTYKKNGNITISALLSETANLVADHTWLYNISKRSGGAVYKLDKVNELIATLLKNADYKTVNYSQKKLSELISIKWLLAFLLLLFSVEWLIRKRNGLV